MRIPSMNDKAYYLTFVIKFENGEENCGFQPFGITPGYATGREGRFRRPTGRTLAQRAIETIPSALIGLTSRGSGAGQGSRLPP
jgi:hypothetical protein